MAHSKFLTGLVLLSALSTAPLTASAQTYVCLETSEGDICLDLLPEVAPNTVSNFLNYVYDGDYNESIIHRSVPNFVIQGGGYAIVDTLVTAIPADLPIANEFARSNLRGTVAMAQSNSPDSATNQWFINLADNSFLDSPPTLVTKTGYFTVFAEVILGMEVVDAIAGMTRFNAGAPFDELPAKSPLGIGTIPNSDLIIIHRAYATDVLPGTVVVPPLLPYQCSTTSPGDTLTEFCGSTLTFPVAIGGLLYEATLTYRPDLPGLAFSVDRSTLKLITDIGQNHASFSNNHLMIPDVRIGAKVYQQVVMQMTSFANLEFVVETYNQL